MPAQKTQVWSRPRFLTRKVCDVTDQHSVHSDPKPGRIIWDEVTNSRSKAQFRGNGGDRNPSRGLGLHGDLGQKSPRCYIEMKVCIHIRTWHQDHSVQGQISSWHNSLQRNCFKWTPTHCWFSLFQSPEPKSRHYLGSWDWQDLAELTLS